VSLFLISNIECLLCAKMDVRVYSGPIASNISAGTFAGILKIEKT